jgi:sulfoxide reductase heme-binding subunit YedZ
MALSKKHWVVIKAVVLLLGILPFLLLIKAAMLDQLGANPIEELHFGFGDWALRFLCVSLAITPYKSLTGQSWPTRFRRMIGLFAFFYAAMHFLVYIVLDLSLSVTQFIEEVPRSPYILMGLLTFILLIPLAVTSTKNMQKKLGRSWFKVHRLIYLAAFTALLHYFWLVKLDYTEPLIYAVVITILLAMRVPKYYNKSRFAANLRR